jgi:hypothetical protein
MYGISSLIGCCLFKFKWNGKEVVPVRAREDLIKLLLIIILLQLFAILVLVIK